MLAVIHVLGSMLMMFSITYVLPVAASLIYSDGQFVDFVVAALICLAAGLVVWASTRSHRREMRSRDGFLLVSLAWVMMSAIATVPLLMAVPGLSFTDAFFETMSGLSTTGATVLVGLEDLPRPSISGAMRSTGTAAWASSCWRSRSCRCWESAACRPTKQRRRAHQGRKADPSYHPDRQGPVVRLLPDPPSPASCH